jgi:uncharacterized protein (TIGR02118 family)
VHVSLLAFEQDSAAPAGAETLLARLPGVRLCLWGALRKVGGRNPPRPCAALLAFDDDDMAPLLADPARAGARLDGTGIEPASLHVESIEATFEIPLEPRREGQGVFALVASFDYADGPGDAAAAERHYLEYHVRRSRELPAMRGYVTGKILPHATTGVRRQRMGIEIFDSREMLAEAFRSQVGEDVMRDGEYVCANVAVYHLDGTVAR